MADARITDEELARWERAWSRAGFPESRAALRLIAALRAGQAEVEGLAEQNSGLYLAVQMGAKEQDLVRSETKELRESRDRLEGALDLADREGRLAVAALREANAESYRLNLEVHWLECPLPPDAGCEPCHERTRMRALHPEHRWTEGELRGTFEVRDAENERFRLLAGRLR